MRPSRFRVLPISAAVACALSLLPSGLLRAAPEPDQKLEVRYYFRERVEKPAPGGKKYSAVAFERESLPKPRLAKSSGQQLWLSEGRVSSLPYRFMIRWPQGAGASGEKVEVNVLDATKNPLPGFPQTLELPRTAETDSREKTLELPVSDELKAKIASKLLQKNQRLTRVELRITSSP